jgi:hypothetical protein
MSILPLVILAVLALLPLAVLVIQIIIKLITKGAAVALHDASDTNLQKPLQPKWQRLIYGLSAFYFLLSIVVTSWAVGTLLNPSGSLASYIYFAAIVSLVCAGAGIWLAYLTKRYTGTWMQPISSTKTIIEWENKRADNALKIFGYYLLGMFGLIICIMLILVFLCSI